jgi:integrase
MKIGRVKLTEHPEGWRIRYTDPATHRDIRLRLGRISESKAIKAANHIDDQLKAGRGWLPDQPARAPELDKGLDEALALTRASDTTNDERRRQFGLFTAWLASHHPEIRSWSDMRPAILQHYLKHLEEERDLAYDSVRLALAPIKLAWRHLANNWPDLVRPLPRLRQQGRPPRRVDCLTKDELLDLLDWLQQHAPDLYPMACLQGLAGLRMLESASLRAQDVDLKAGLVTVTDTERHTVKTEESARVIPVCRRVIEALRELVKARKKGPLFLNEKGEPHERHALTRRWTRALAHIAAKPHVKKRSHDKRLMIHPHGLDRPRLGAFPARKLRAAFATLVDETNKIPDRVLKAYIGHAAGDMLGQHYRRVDPKELTKVPALIDRLIEPKAEPGKKPAKKSRSKHQAAETA